MERRDARIRLAGITRVRNFCTTLLGSSRTETCAHIHVSEFASERTSKRARARACRCAVHTSSGRAQGERRAVLRALVGVDARPVRALRSDRQGDACSVCASPMGRGYLYHRQRRIARDAPTKRRAAPRQPRAGLLIPARARDDIRARTRTRGRWLREISASRFFYAAEKRTR